MRLADPECDFTRLRRMLIIGHAHNRITGGGNALGTIDTEDGSLSSLRLNTFPLSGTIYRWRWTGAHEFAHNLGPLDLYRYNPTAHQPPPAPRGHQWVSARFGLMSMWAHFHTVPQEPRLAFRWSFPNGSTSTGYDYNPEAEDDAGMESVATGLERCTPRSTA